MPETPSSTRTFGRSTGRPSGFTALRFAIARIAYSTSYLDGMSSGGLNGGRTFSSSVIIGSRVSDLVFSSLLNYITQRFRISVEWYGTLVHEGTVLRFGRVSVTSYVFLGLCENSILGMMMSSHDLNFLKTLNRILIYS